MIRFDLINAAKFTNYIHIYFANHCRKVSEQHLDETEELDVMVVPLELTDLLARMREDIAFVDRFHTTTGAMRSKPLKKARVFSKLEFYLSERDHKQIMEMKDPMAAIERPEERITIYRNDGSYVVLTTQFSKVKIQDSKKPGMYSVMEADQFLRNIVHW